MYEKPRRVVLVGMVGRLESRTDGEEHGVHRAVGHDAAMVSLLVAFVPSSSVTVGAGCKLSGKCDYFLFCFAFLVA